jgi:hypothetical protein
VLIIDLAERPDWISTLARWHFDSLSGLSERADS